MTPLVSIIVPNYNHAAFLQERLDSIFKQTCQDFEVIILDDASTDDSLEILNVYKEHPKVSHFVVNTTNSGSPFLQWQKGLALATGNYVWIAESDDTCDLDFLASNIENINDADGIVAHTESFNAQGIINEVQHPAFKKGTSISLDTDSILYCPILNVSAFVFKRNIIQPLHKPHFTSYKLIGDRIFYYEFFQGKKLLQNRQTKSYFRQEGLGVSNLGAKDIQYLKKYFQEHRSFIDYVSKNETLPKHFKKMYVDRYFKRVRDRLSRSEKFSFTYLQIYLSYVFTR